MVELAIVLPVLLLIVVGILTFGLYMSNQNQETQLAATAARYASINYNPSTTGQTLQTYMQTQASGELQGGNPAEVTQVQVYLYYPTGYSASSTNPPVRACLSSTVTPLPILGVRSLTFQMLGVTTMRFEPPTGTATTWSQNLPPAGSPCPLS